MIGLPITDAQTHELIQRLIAANPEYAAFVQQHAFLGEFDVPADEAAALERELLTVLMESPQQAARIDAMLLTPAPPAPHRATVPPLLAAAFLLRAHVQFRRAGGGWEPLIRQGPSDSEALRALLQRLATLFSAAPAKDSAEKP